MRLFPRFMDQRYVCRRLIKGPVQPPMPIRINPRRFNIAIENQWLSDEPDAPGAFNHSQQILTDSLAIYNLLSELDSSLSNDDYKAILAASVTGTAGSYEGIIDTLFYLIGAGGLSLPVGNAYRDDLYNAIYDLQDTVTFQSLAGFVTIRSANTVTASQAATDFSSFLSLTLP